jgi:class 3 adenylate cyclase/tetratricopeptide (TPR) repeat protein
MLRAVEDTRRELDLGDAFSVRIGANTGEILAGELGGAVIREFAVIGDAVNVAARLKDLAPPGRAWVGPRTQAAGGERFEWNAQDVLKLKGRQQSIQPWELVGARDRARIEATAFCPLIGRDAERDALVERLDALSAGRGGAVWIGGEAGSGKSRLLAEALAARPDLDVRTPGPDALATALAAGPDPRVVVVDEADRAGADAWATLGQGLAVSLAWPVLIVVEARPGGPPGLDGLRRRMRELGERHLELELGPLPAPELERVVDAVAGDHPLDDDVRALVLERSDGNPSHAIQGVFLADALQADAARAEAHSERGDEAERRRTTVLFADLAGFTSLAETTDRATLHDLVTSCLDRMSAVARRHGGTVEKYLGDCVLAVFGAPVAIEDAPRAALNAALEMRESVAAFNRERDLASPLGIHTGIDTGLGIAGDVSGPVIREFTLLGASVNRSSHLKDVAPTGTIWVGEETWRAARDVFDFDEVEPDEAGRVFELRSTEPRLHRDAGAQARVSSALVGRRAELGVLNAAAEDLRAGRGGLIAVVGEAGLGKSRLVEEWLAGLGEGIYWLKGRSLSIGRSLAFHPFADLLARWCGIEEGDDEGARLSRLQAAADDLLDHDASEVTPFLAVLMGLPPPEAERARLEQINVEAMDKLILAAVMRTLRELAARTPLALVFEDLHWADLSSIELLESLLHLPVQNPILIVAPFRPHHADTSDRIAASAHERLGDALRRVELRPLGDDAALEMLRNLFRGGDVPPTLLAAVRERARGNPFYVEEVVRSLRDAGALVERDGALEPTARIRDVEIPGTLQEVVMARVDRLDRARRDVLRAASAIGGSFAREVLEEVTGKDELLELLGSLEDAELLDRSPRTGEYRFKHPLIQEVVYDSLVAERRETLHRAIGRAIEARMSETAPGYHAMLAYHFSRGRDLERAEAYLFRAGDEASRAAASDEALRFFREASALYLELHGEAGDPEKMAILERHIAMALANRGRYVEAIEHFDEALRHREVPVTNNQALLATRLARDLTVVLGRLYLPGARRARPVASEGQKAIQALIYDRARAQTTSAMGRYLFDWMDGLRRLDSVDPRSLPLAGGQYASTVGIFSFGGVSFAVSERFLDLAREIVNPDDPTDQMIFGFMNSFHHFLAGNWGDEHEVPEVLVKDRIRNGQLFDVTNYLAICAEKRVCQGRFEEALGVMEGLEEIADLYQFDLAVSSLHGLSAFLALEQGLFEDAVEAADIHYTQHDDPLLNILALSTRAKAQVHAGDPDAAAHSLATAGKLLKRAPGVVPPYYTSAFTRARLQLEVDALERGTGNPRRARRAGRAARRAMNRVASRQPEVLELEGTLRFLTGDRRGAERWWQKSLDVADALGMAPIHTRTQAQRERRLHGS